MRFDATPERRPLFVRRERHGRHGTTPVVDGDGEAVTYAESCGFLEKLTLDVRQLSRPDIVPPFERLGHLQHPANHRI